MIKDKKLIEAMFDEALRLRNADDLMGSRSLLTQLVQQADPDNKSALGHSHMQLGLIAQLCGEYSERDFHYQTAVAILPHSELASTALFGALFLAGRFREAFEEMVRLLRLTYSPKYEETVSAPGFGAELTGELRELCREARRLLAKRRPAYREALRQVAKRRPN